MTFSLVALPVRADSLANSARIASLRAVRALLYCIGSVDCVLHCHRCARVRCHVGNIWQRLAHCTPAIIARFPLSFVPRLNYFLPLIA